MTTETTVEQRFEMIPTGLIQESKTNPRKTFDAAGIEELAASIKEKGIIEPLIVRPLEDKDAPYELVAGARRLRAARKAKLEDVPCLVRELSDDQALEIQVIENLQRRDLHPLEEAEGYKAMLKRPGYDVEGLASKTGKSVSYVYQRLKLTELSQVAKDLFLHDEITAAHAILLARLNQLDQKAALEICFESVWIEEKEAKALIPVRALQRWIEANLHTDLAKAPWGLDDKHLVPTMGPCTTCPRRTGTCPSLFPEVEKGSVCTDRTCYQTKLHRWFELKLKSIESGGFKAVRISTLQKYSVPAHEREGDVKYDQQWVRAGAKKCQHLAKGVFVDGKDRGSVIDVCPSGTCQTHTGYRPVSAATNMESTPEQRKKAREKEEAQQAKDEQREALSKELFLAVVRRAPKKLDLAELRETATNLNYVPEELYEAMGWKDGNMGSVAKIEKMSEPEVVRFLFGAALANYGRIDEERVLKACKRLKVDAAKIKAGLEQKWAAAMIEETVDDIVAHETGKMPKKKNSKK